MAWYNPTTWSGEDVANVATGGAYGAAKKAYDLTKPVGVDPSIAAQQQALIAQLMAASRGEAPSAAETMLRQQRGEMQAGQMGMANSARGVSPATALRLGQTGAANIGAKMTGQAAAMRADEQARSQGLLAQLLAARSQQDLAAKQADRQFWGGLIGAGGAAMTGGAR